MVLASMRAPQSGNYILQGVLESPVEFDADLLRCAWSEVARRHPALRSTIESDAEGSFIQRVQESPEFDLRLAAYPLDLQQWLSADCEEGFDFARGIPSRLTLLQKSGGCALVWTNHHVLIDGGSHAIAWRELLACYDALRAGVEWNPPDAPPFSAHLEWLKHQDWGAAESYWRDMFAGVEQTSGYVVDRIAATSREAAIGRQTVTASEALTQALEDFAARQQVTVSTLVQAAWAVLLSRYSGCRDVVFGVTRGGRRTRMPGIERSVGMFVNTVPLRVPVPYDAPFSIWLQELQARWRALGAFEHTPLNQILEWSGLLPGAPLYDNLLNYNHRTLADEIQRPVTLHQRTDIGLALAAYGTPRLSLTIIHDSRLIGRDMASAMTGHLLTLLENFLSSPDSRLADLKMLTPQEEQIFASPGPAQPVEILPACVHNLVERQVERTPERVALEAPSGAISYDTMNRQANRLARCLRERGSGPNDLVAVRIDRSSDTAIAVLAILKAGAAFLPLDPTLPPQRIEAMIETARPKLILDNLADWREAMSQQPDSNLEPLAGPHDAAYAIFTSGSTGRPKAVLVTHRSIVNHTLEATRIYGITASDRRLQFASIGTDVFVAEVFNYLSRGATLVFGLAREGVTAGKFFRFLEDQRITITGIPSTWWTELTAALAEARFELPTSLRALIAGMERVDPTVFQTWRRLTARRVRWFNAYGPTETTGTATIYEAGSSEWEGQSYVPIGKPLANVRTYVLDAGRSPLPAGVVGELYIGGAGVAMGYLGAPELTAERFLPDPFAGSPDARMYRTGDLAFFLPDGNLVFAGRADRQVKIRGHRVELEEIEAVLARHEQVRQCAVIVHSQNGPERLIAYLTASEGAPDRDSLRAHLGRHLPEHMLPAAFITLPEMPRTPSGKLDRLALSRRDPGNAEPQAKFEEPSTLTEMRLAVIWCDVLGVPGVGRGCNFFDLGGDSLRSTRLITRIRREFGAELSLPALVAAPTLSQLGAVLDSGTSTARPSDIMALQSAGSKMPVYLVADYQIYRRMVFHMGARQPVYTIRPVSAASVRELHIEDFVAEYLARLRAFQPHGPYCLGGWCQSGLIALEIARQLRAAGEDVLLVVLFDAMNPAAASQWSWRALSGKLSFHLDALRNRKTGRLDYIKKHVQTFVLRLRGRLWRGVYDVARVSGARVIVDEDAVCTLSIVRSSPQPYAGRVLLFTCQDNSGIRYLGPDYGWGEVIGNLEVVSLPGDHREIFDEPFAATIARELSARLNSLDATASTTAAHSGPSRTGSPERSPEFRAALPFSAPYS